MKLGKKWRKIQSEKKMKICKSMGISLVVYQSDRNKPDKAVNGNNVVVSNRVAGRWRVDGQSGAERIGDNRERDNWITADGPEMSSQQQKNSTDRQLGTQGGRKKIEK